MIENILNSNYCRFRIELNNKIKFQTRKFKELTKGFKMNAFLKSVF